MSPTQKLLALGAACVACCALPSAGALLAAAGLAGIGWATLGWVAGVAVPVVAAVVVLLRRRAARSCAIPAPPSRAAGLTGRRAGR
jgi:membrane protein implicated in regulation of membrane protease activity